MSDWALIAVRWALYLDLMLAFGLPLFSLYTPGVRALTNAKPAVLLALVVAGLALSTLSIALVTAAMAGVPLSELDAGSLRTMIGETAVGHAWLARMGALIALAAILLLRRGTVAPATVLSGIALASLAWAGHGAAGEGSAGWVQLAADIAHLLAGGAWLGAIVAFATMVFSQTDTRTAHDALQSFARAGSVFVALVIASGLVNAAYLVGIGHLAHLSATPYGRLLIVKLVLFAALLCLAALNRFALTPKLTRRGDAPVTIIALRRSLLAEAAAATAILAVVAWMGTLEPPISA